MNPYTSIVNCDVTIDDLGFIEIMRFEPNLNLDDEIMGWFIIDRYHVDAKQKVSSISDPVLKNSI